MNDTELPAGWEWARLEDLLAVEPRPITDGPFGSNLKSAHYTDSGARVFRLQNVGDGVFRDERAYISMGHFEKLRAHEAVTGDLLLASLGEVLPRVAIVPQINEPAIVKADVIRARLHPAVERKWVLYALLSPQVRAYANRRIKGVGRPRLGLGEIRKIPVPIPPFLEQCRIVESLEAVLSGLDAAVETTLRSRRRLEGLRKAAFLGLVPESFPADWRVVTVEDAGKVELGRARHPDWHNGPDMRPYLRVANVFEDRIDASDVMEMDFSGVWEKYKLHPGDVLLNEGQSPHLVGRPALYRGVPENVAFTNSLLRFQANEDVLPEWALMVFRRHLHAKRFMQEVRITTNIAHLSAKRLKAVEFPIPPLDVQKKLVVRCEELLTGIAAVDAEAERSLRRAEALRKALLSRAFTGQLVPQDPSDEPASVLLERIRAERAAQPKPKRTRRAVPRKTSTTPAPEPTSAPRTSTQQELPL